MEPNLGVVDCLARIALGLALLALALAGSLGAWAYLVGLASLVTGTLWVCPAYRVLGIVTRTEVRCRLD